MITDYKGIRNFALGNCRKKWYGEFCSLYDSGVRASTVAKFIVDTYPDIASELKSLSEYHQTSISTMGRVRGSVFSAQDLLALRHPKVNNACQTCGIPVGYNKQTGNWFIGCCLSHGTKVGMVKVRERWVDKLGVDNPMKLKSVQENQKASLMESHGVDNPMKSKKIRKKYEKTMMGRYGVDSVNEIPDILERRKKGSLLKHGVDHPMKVSDIKDKMMASRDSNPDNKYASFRYKLHKDRWGKVHRIQGYENRAIDYFSSKRKNVKDVTEIVSGTANVPRFRYVGEDGEVHNYYPDLLVKSKKGEYIVEVKSTYTLTSEMGKSMRKFRTAVKSCKRHNRTFIVMVYREFSDIPIIFVNPTTKQVFKDKGLL